MPEFTLLDPLASARIKLTNGAVARVLSLCFRAHFSGVFAATSEGITDKWQVALSYWQIVGDIQRTHRSVWQCSDRVTYERTVLASAPISIFDLNTNALCPFESCLLLAATNFNRTFFALSC